MWNGVLPVWAKSIHLCFGKGSRFMDQAVKFSVLKSYLWLLTYYGRFLPGLSTVLAPLNAMLSTAAYLELGDQSKMNL